MLNNRPVACGNSPMQPTQPSFTMRLEKLNGAMGHIQDVLAGARAKQFAPPPNDQAIAADNPNDLDTFIRAIEMKAESILRASVEIAEAL